MASRSVISQIKLTLAVLIVLCSFSASAFTSDTIIVFWNNAALQAIRESHSGPPQAARILAMTHTCVAASPTPIPKNRIAGSSIVEPAVLDKRCSKATPPFIPTATAAATYCIPRLSVALPKAVLCGCEPRRLRWSRSSWCRIFRRLAWPLPRSCRR